MKILTTRILSLLLALVMLVALGAFASAENSAAAEEAAVTLTDEDVASLSYLNGQLRFSGNLSKGFEIRRLLFPTQSR